MRRIAEWLMLALLMLPTPAAAQVSLQGEIRFRAATDSPGWVGQERQLHLELWSTGFRFGEQQFLVPEVAGGFLLQADASTVKLSETRAGEAWQGLRYTLLLYPQRAGRVEVPPFDVHFSASAGFGTEAAPFHFRTGPLAVESRLPPGAGPGLLVTTSNFSVRAAWSRSPPEEGPLDLRVGDALTLEVVRQARDVPAMVLPPLAVGQVSGLALYPARPRVSDTVNRGTLTGERHDAITFVCEREGRIEIPALSFQWWDPDREVLREESIPAQVLEVAANPAYAASTVGSAADEPAHIGRWLAAIPLLAVMAFALRRWLWPMLAESLQRQRTALQAGEARAFRRARKACADGVPAKAYDAVMQWLGRADPAAAVAGLLLTAERHGDGALRREALALQQAVADGRRGGWDGTRLAQMLRRLRARLRRQTRKQDRLQALNPRGSQQGNEQQAQQD
jgi:hypothetical protein